jgi:hypothetical protein
MAPSAYVCAAAAAGGLAMNIANSTSGSGVPSTYRPGNTGYQDQSFNNLTNLMNNYAMTLPQQTIPQFQAAQQNISNNPYAALAQQGANQAGAAAPGVAGMQFGGANSLFGAGNQVLGQAFDPQQALYNRTQQQVMDQINAANAASGVSGPAASGVAQQGINNFNIDWQNNLLNRERMGIQAGGQAFSGASDLGGLGMQTLQTGGAMPYNTYYGQQQNIIGGLNSLNSGVMGSFALPQQQMGDIASYLGLATPGDYAALAAQGQNFNQGQSTGSGIINSLYALGNNQALQGGGINSLFAPAQQPGQTTGFDPTSFDYSNSGFGDLMAA